MENDGSILHATVTVRDFEVDEKIAPLIEELFEHGYGTMGSCQNYGEYVRSLGMDFNNEAKRDYAYLEYKNFEDAFDLIAFVRRVVPVNSMLHAKVHQTGTPDAWDIRWIFDRDTFWVLFPESDIPEVTALFLAQHLKEPLDEEDELQALLEQSNDESVFDHIESYDEDDDAMWGWDFDGTCEECHEGLFHADHMDIDWWNDIMGYDDETDESDAWSAWQKLAERS